MMTNTKEVRDTLPDEQKVKARIQNNWGGIFEKNLWYCKSVDGFKLAKRGRRYYYASAILEYEILEEKPRQTWEQAWTAVAKSMRKHNFNIEMAKAIEENVRIGLPALQELEELDRLDWKQERPRYDTPEYEADKKMREERYKAWQVKYGSTARYATYHLSLGTQNHWGAKMPKIATMNLYKQNVQQAYEEAIRTGKGYTSQNSYGGNNGRDRSLEIKKLDDGSFMVHYASEYVGCGNGAYYAPISMTRALYCEHD